MALYVAMREGDYWHRVALVTVIRCLFNPLYPRIVAIRWRRWIFDLILLRQRRWPIRKVNRSFSSPP